MTTWRSCRVLWGRRSTKTNFKLSLLIVLLLTVVIYILKVTSNQREPVIVIADGDNDIDISWAEPEKCPACFGDKCELLRRGHFVKVDSESDRYMKKGIVSTGRIGGVKVIAKSMNEAGAWQRYERFICRSSSRPQVCNASSFTLETMLVTNVALKVPWLREAWKICHLEKSALSLCVSDRFLEDIRQLYVEDEGTDMTKEGDTGRAFLSTSLLLNEEAVLLRYFTTKSTTPWPFPKFYGACGRVIVVEHAGKTLDTFMDSSWEVRADIALQLLQLVDALREKDPDWVLFFLDVSFQNFAVDSRGWVRLIDLDDVMVIDRRTVVNQEQTEMCNEQCYMDFQKKLYSDEYHCEDILKYTPMMYASICARLLSNLQKHPERRKWGELREYQEGQSVDLDEPPGKGLLHNPPDEMREALEGALTQCVQETLPRGRLGAVLRLQEILGTT